MSVAEAPRALRRDIEGLRAIAVLAVIACHCGISWCSGGFIGVDVFFVLSGYLISGLLAAEYRATSRIDLPAFYARRARRLLPACILVLSVTSLVGALVMSPQEMISTAEAARSAGLYISNIFFDRSASDYFARNVQGNPLLHTWSLGLEEQFYVAWPLLLLAALRTARSARFLRPLLAVVAAASFVCGLYTTRHAPTFAFYELPARAWEFAAGGLLALVPAATGTGAKRPARWPLWCAAIGLTAILTSIVLLNGGSQFPGWIALLPVAGTVAALLAGEYEPHNRISRLLHARPLQFVGSRSYAWYLWHWPFIVFAGVLYPSITVAGKIVAALAALAAAALTFTVLEHPVRSSGRLRARAGLSLRFAAACTLLTLGVSWALMVHGRQLAEDSAYRFISAATVDVAAMPIKSCVSEGRSLEVTTCDFGSLDSTHSVVLFGDSHAVQWFNAFQGAAKAQAWRLITVMRFGCAASDINPHQLVGEKYECGTWRARALEKIIALKPSVVVMASYTGATIRPFRDEPKMPLEELQEGTRRTLQAFANAGIRVVLLRDTPLPPFDIPACVARAIGKPAQPTDGCSFDASAALDQAAFSAEHAAAEGLSNVSYLDMSDLICTGSSCQASQHGLLVYRDDNHLTGTFAASLAPALRARLFSLLGYSTNDPPGTRI